MSFSIRIQRRAKEFEDAVLEAMKRTTQRIQQQLVLTTPVDTGRARSNWLVTIGHPTELQVEPRTASQAIAGGVIASEALRNVRETLWITNNVPYLAILNTGTSNQAPAGFVENAVDHGRSALLGIKVFK